ncbi:aspartate-semialdehyde dehydrogenase [Peptoanaerobacter stomatis]|uniref:Aspartate-semialdehyde dehydrogenase n=1 Tax=Peptoanaerobacter stomatis TaxID=796937 RepID=J5W5Z2_9FIRM|nr:aspartate-semialdehyde dehydrogenase [Peptoanaerobacter stomatis]EJU19537.1 aspartate-semialdehyde dehydrogenase [Peptoanaerobacter stomatis]NWO25318.1 aspartate-semialdehyde dehydrogenase [Peptostreptococcaceae bacterium oral taxon 081]
MSKALNIAVVGATGRVGSTFIEVLQERKFPINNIYFFASAKSAGKKIEFAGKEYEVEELTENSFDRDLDLALFSAGGSTSKKFAPIAASKGIIVVDNSSQWRMDKNVPLIVPEVNFEDIKKYDSKIIANPNCSTIQSVMPLKVLDERFKIKRIVYSTYQAVSGSGFKGIKDLEEGMKGNPPTNYPHPIFNNCLPHIDEFLDNGYTKEEEKMINETRKILDRDDLKITATTVRVPVMNSHSVSINIEFEKPFEMKDIYDELSKVENLVIVDDVKNNQYPMAINATGTDEVYIGRIRRDFSTENGINLWDVADNIRKGAASNAIQIAEKIFEIK